MPTLINPNTHTVFIEEKDTRRMIGIAPNLQRSDRRFRGVSANYDLECTTEEMRTPQIQNALKTKMLVVKPGSAIVADALITPKVDVTDAPKVNPKAK